MFKLKLFLTVIVFCGLMLQMGSAAAQEDEVALDEDVAAKDLDISEPNILPDNPLYLFKDIGRGIQNLFTFDSVKKVELKQKFANEKLIELKLMIESKKSEKRIKNALSNYEREVKDVKEASEKIKKKVEEGEEEADKFLDKFVKQQILHQRILQKLEEQVPEESLQRISEARERHLERFGEVMAKLQEKEEDLQKRLEENLEEIKGSRYKHFKNLEILLELEEKVPESAREAIKKAQENSLRRLHDSLENMSLKDQERFKEYLNKISGEKEIKIEILENLKGSLEGTDISRQLLRAREDMINRVLEEETEERDCPETRKPASDFCKDGRIVIRKNDEGCILGFSCVIPSETNLSPTLFRACATLWDPICGVNGKTYSNACFAKLENVQIASEGICRETELESKTESEKMETEDIELRENKILEPFRDLIKPAE